MIKLIATDLDGTLLNSDKRLPLEFPKLFRALKERNILFVPVSGRSYPRLCELFGPASGDMSFICSNGDLVMHDGKAIYHSAFTEKQLYSILYTLRDIPGLHTCLCGVHAAYYEDRLPRVEDQMKEFFGNIIHVHRIENRIGTEPIGKVSNIDDRGVQINSFPRVAHLADDYYIVDAGDNWLDIMPAGVDKGGALLELCRALGISTDEIMVFGDFLNDIPMMKTTGNSWCMKNGHDEVKRISGHVTEWTNDENGVIRTLKKELGLGF